MHLNPTDAAWDALKERQRERESFSFAEGERRFREQVRNAAERGEYSRSSVARKLMQGGLEPLEKAIEAWFLTFKGKRGQPPVAAKWIERVGVNVAAYMTLKVVLDHITGTWSLANVCQHISELMLDELRYRRLQEQAPALFEYKLKRFRTSSYAHMARSMDHAVRTAHDRDGNLIDTADLQMTRLQQSLVGGVLVQLLIQSTSLVRIVRKKEHKGRRLKLQDFIEPTEETETWLFQRTEHLAVLEPQHQPMIVPPRQWEPGKRGGFYFALRGKHTLVRGLHDPKFRHEVFNADMPLVYATLNSLQNTAWRINRSVYDLVIEIQRRGGNIAGVPATEPVPQPVRPADIDTNTEARERWSKEAGLAHDREHARRAHARETTRLVGSAEGVLNEEAIFFPYSLDFRGRIYPISDYLHPQGHDLAKALLTFAQGKPVDEDGAGWLAIHGANCLGKTTDGQKVSKMTFEERIAWVVANTKRIERVADDPFGDLWWADVEEVDDPLQFYAFCVEWRNLQEASRRGETYVSSLPCSMDGSCNGLQHFSAMFRDPVGGAAVNVVPQDRPQDIYQRVADVLLDRLQEMPDDPVAVKLLGSKLVTRKLAKRPTMTFGYGSKRFGFKKQLKDYFRSLPNWPEMKRRFTTIEDGKEKSQVGVACALLAKLIDEALAHVVVKAAEGMQWMQKSARAIVKNKKTVEWTVPVTGFRVRQEYVKWKEGRVETVLAGSIIRRPVVWLPTENLDPIKQVNAIAPNVVHSLDAAALMLTVSDAAANGVEAFAMVHDSYGALAADCASLAGCCRRAFVKLYQTQDVVALLYEQFLKQSPDCPLPPEKGTLEVSEVLASDYFFA